MKSWIRINLSTKSQKVKKLSFLQEKSYQKVLNDKMN